MTARRDWKAREGVAPEWCNDAERRRRGGTRHVGKDRRGRWWGWSHRARAHFTTKAAASRFAHSVS